MKLGEGTTPGPFSEPKTVQDGYGDWNDVITDTNTGNRITIERDGDRLDTEYSMALVKILNKAPLLIECRDVLADLSHWFDVQLKRGTINAGTANKDSDFVTQIRALLAKLES